MFLFSTKCNEFFFFLWVHTEVEESDAPSIKSGRSVMHKLASWLVCLKIHCILCFEENKRLYSTVIYIQSQLLAMSIFDFSIPHVCCMKYVCHLLDNFMLLLQISSHTYLQSVTSYQWLHSQFLLLKYPLKSYFYYKN